MSSAVASEARPDVLETVRALPAEGQDAALNFALFLQQQEEQRPVAADEAEWDRLFNDPVKMANFAKWADEHANGPSEPLDFARL